MKKPIVIEILIWISILLTAIGIGIYAYIKTFVEPNVHIIQFKDIDGITKGSPVRFMGINVGYVRALKSKDKHVNVQILITKKGMEIPNGTLARVEFYGLGGSKSIELMPPDSSCEVGILTGNTIRLNDVAHEAISLVGIIEMVEKYVKNINEKSVQKFLTEIKSLNDEKIKNVGNEFDNIEGGISEKFETIKTKQRETTQKIKDVNNNVEKLNEFIKK
ncbi:MAG: MCE family protein [Candidatus Gastranaerophilales bacterium]|nr:MCE family protein [Candidatus Gastranaerophilales bacterium]